MWFCKGSEREGVLCVPQEQDHRSSDWTATIWRGLRRGREGLSGRGSAFIFISYFLCYFVGEHFLSALCFILKGEGLSIVVDHFFLQNSVGEHFFCFVLKSLLFTGRERRPEESRWGNTQFLSKFISWIGEPKKFYIFFTPHLFPLKYSLASFWHFSLKFNNHDDLQVKINHIDIPMGDIEKNESTYADSSIGEGMDITIQVAWITQSLYYHCLGLCARFYILWPDLFSFDSCSVTKWLCES